MRTPGMVAPVVWGCLTGPPVGARDPSVAVLQRAFFRITSVGQDDAGAVAAAELQDRHTLRVTAAADKPALRSFLVGLCLEARRLRFFSGGVDIDGAAHLAADTSAGRFGLVAHDEIGCWSER